MQISLTIMYPYIQMQNISKELKAHFRLWYSFSQHILWTGAMMLLILNVLSVKWQCWSSVLLKTEKNEKEICSPLPSWGTSSSKKKKILFLYFQREWKGGKKRGRETLMHERHINPLLLAPPQLWAWPTTQACALTRNWTINLSIGRCVLKPLSHTHQGLLDPFPFLKKVVLEKSPLVFPASFDL